MSIPWRIASRKNKLEKGERMNKLRNCFSQVKQTLGSGPYMFAKRVVTLILCVCMVVGVIGMSPMAGRVFAADNVSDAKANGDEQYCR